MTILTQSPPIPLKWSRTFYRNSGLAVAIFTFLAIFGVLNLKLAHGFGYYEISSTASSSTPLALAAIGATIVVISGGLDLSAGAVISLCNCLIAAYVGTTTGSMILWSLMALASGALVGAVNGFFVVVMRVQSVIVTLATMFIVEGLTLLVLDQPGGSLPPEYSNFFSGDTVPGLLPTPVLILASALVLWTAIRRTRFGTNIYAAGSDPEGARSKGVPVRATQFAVYVLAGLFYSAAGVFLTAQTGSGDPTVGPPMLLPIFVAVVLGGTLFAGGRGGCVGTVFGAVSLMLIVNLLLVFNVPTYYSTVVEGALLIFAVLSGSLRRSAPVWAQLGFARLKITALRQRVSRSRIEGLSMASPTLEAPRSDDSLSANALRRWLTVNAETLRFVVPAYIALAAVLVATATLFGSRITMGTYLNSLFVLASFMSVLALGQGSVVISGGIDLSMPAVITFSGVLLTSLASGSNSAAVFAIPMVLALGAAVGALNGFGIVVFGIFPLIMTLAMNGIIQGFALVYSNGTPSGVSPPIVSWMMTGNLFGFTPVVAALTAFVIAATALISGTAYGRRLRAVGNSQTVALFSGVPVGATLVKTYMLSGVCSALAGIMLVGFSGQAFNDMGEPYLLPAIAVVVIGGTLMTGGRGHYLGMFGGALLLTALTTFLTGLLLPVAVKSIIFGAVILVAVLGLRERAV